MKTWRALRGRTEDLDAPDLGEAAEPATERWNTLSVVGVGPVADVDQRGAIFARARPVSVEVWFGAGDKWVRGTSADGVRQTRLAGMPVIETRQRLGDGDVVQTASADAAGSGLSRVVLSLSNELDVAVVAAVVVRPYTLLGPGRIETARIAEQRIVVDSLPLVELDRIPGDCGGAVDSDRDTPSLLERLELSAGELLGDRDITDEGGRASFAALVPLTPGVPREVQIVEGQAPSTVAPAPIESVVSGWQSHLRNAVEIDLPAWPNHVPGALLSGMLGAAPDSRPFGDSGWEQHEDTLLVAALGSAGLYRPAVTVAARLLESVTEGRLDRKRWPALAAALCWVADSEPGDKLLESHGEAVVAVIGHTLSVARSEALVPRLLRVIELTHGPEAAADAAAIRGDLTQPEDAIVFARHGFAVPDQSAAVVRDALDGLPQPLAATDIGLAMSASASIGRPFEPVVPMRSLAGSTWSWPRNGCGDSPHARAALFIGMRSLSLLEYPGASGVQALGPNESVELDLFPGLQSSWLGQSMEFSQMRTTAGNVSAAIRWHGARPALLWEVNESPAAFVLTCQRLDPNFRSSEPYGETLLAAPQGFAQ